jgi:ribosomal protein S18 acetylase RimI-like enzyme
MHLRPYSHPSDEQQVVALWTACGLTRPWNDPAKDIARKLTVQPDLFLVGELDHEIVATGMFGFDGTRGWVHYLAVAPTHQGESLGRALMAEGEIGFYESLGYVSDGTVTLGKRIIPDA